MLLKRAVIQGFRSFAEPQEIAFDASGLVFVTGKNLVEPSLGANGAGKSSIFEAICWCLYGKTSRGLKAGNIKNWGGGATQVTVTVEIHGRELEIYRSQSPNKLVISENGGAGREVDQEELESLLGLSFKAFLNTIYFAQFSPGFLDLSPGEQMALFSEVLNLDLWEQAAECAGKEAKALETKLESARYSLGKAQGSLIAKRAFAESEGYRVAELVRDRYYRGLSIQADLKEARKKLAEAEEQAKREDKEQKKKRLELKSRLADLEEEREKAREQVSEWQAEMASLGKIKKPQTRCPTCGAELNRERWQKALKEYQQAQERMAELQELLREGTSWIKDQDAEIKDIRRSLEEDFVELESSKKVVTWRTLVSGLVEDLKRLMQENPPEVDPQLLEELAEQEKEYEELKARVADLESAASSMRYWQKEFKELRLYLIEESLVQLEVESNSALHDLGLEEWGIEFDVEREKKTGGVKTGFSVLIYSPAVSNPVPWEAWSGGESQRLRLAVSMGFASLITSRTGTETNIEFWDEPSTWLSTSGITDLMETLKSRAGATGRQIWIADHRTLDYGGFSKVVTVTKTEAGSLIN